MGLRKCTVNWLAVSLVILLCQMSRVPALRCFSCDSATDEDCKFTQQPTDHAIDCATQCFYSDEGSEYKRGCMNATTNCPSSSTTCRKCTKELCNGAIMVVEKCVACDSTDSEDCHVPNEFTNVIQCNSTTGERSGCYLYKNSADGVVKRGCVVDLDEETFEVCSHGELCKKCHGNACNLKESFQRCFICDSEEDSDCLVVSLNTMKFVADCKDYLDKCAAFVIPNGKTVRGCLKEINPEPTYCPSTNCIICTEPDCNHEIVPPNRLLCYQCNSTADPTCNDPQIANPFRVPSPCITFKFDDECYKFWDEATETGYRGCLSDSSVGVAMCAQHPDRCAVCGYATCNSDYLVREAQLWCYQCDRNTPCMWSFTTPTNPCTNPVAFYETETCYKYLLPSGLMAKRGCTLDDEDFCRERHCDECSGFFCNGESFLKQSCIRCKSSESELCEEEANEMLGEDCIVDPTYSQRGCYSFRDDLGVVHRGCFFDMEENWRNKCETTYSHRCTRCYGRDCNTNLQGSGGFARVSVALKLSFILWASFEILNLRW